MIAFYIILFLVLLLISIRDYATSEIPNALNIVLGVLGLVYYFINIKTNWWIPLVLAFGTFLLFFVFFLITGELAIGGGDMKMIIVSMLFINNFILIVEYMLWFCLFILIGIIVTYANGNGLQYQGSRKTKTVGARKRKHNIHQKRTEHERSRN